MDFVVKLYKNLSKDELKRLKQLCVRATGERLKAFPDHHVIFGGFGGGKRAVAMCCVSLFSPEHHFENESAASVPYLYNYMSDVNYRKHKVAFLLMRFIKEEFFARIGTATLGEINLDVAADSDHAQRFFERNGFELVGEYDKDFGSDKKIKYNMLTHQFKN